MTGAGYGFPRSANGSRRTSDRMAAATTPKIELPGALAASETWARNGDGIGRRGDVEITVSVLSRVDWSNSRPCSRIRRCHRALLTIGGVAGKAKWRLD